MRRKDREVTDEKKIREIILSCHCCRLGFSVNTGVYIVPLSFGYAEKDHERLFYFHGAREGRKMALIAQSPSVGFELDTHYQLQEGESACRYSARHQSIIGSGTVSLITDAAEKEKALQKIMEHYTGRDDWPFTSVMTDSAAVFQLEVTELSCKEHA